MLGEFEEVWVQVGDREWNGSLAVPQSALGLVIVAGGASGGVGDRSVAEALRARGLATLECDLFEDIDDHFDIELAAGRLLALTDWAAKTSRLSHLPIGYVGASTGAAAAVVAASRRPELIRAVVSCGGRADLAGPALPIVSAPTLLVAGGDDDDMIELHRSVVDQMTALTQLAILPGGCETDEVIALTAEWLVDHFTAPRGRLVGPSQPRVVAA